MTTAILTPAMEVVAKGRITPLTVILPKLGVLGLKWIPAFAGMTESGESPGLRSFATPSLLATERGEVSAKPLMANNRPAASRILSAVAGCDMNTLRQEAGLSLTNFDVDQAQTL